MVKKGCPQEQIVESSLKKMEFFSIREEEKEIKKTLLLHSCCGPCSTACIERVLPEYKVTVYFFNPNITDRDEYEKRKAAQIQFLREYNKSLAEEEQIGFIEGEYRPEVFFRIAEGHENDREGGGRCNLCFQLRMEETARKAEKEGYMYFGTTLTVSPHKSYPLISTIGNLLAKAHHIEFLDMDFKKKAGFQRSIEMSREYGLYRQNYCGCQFSKYEK